MVQSFQVHSRWIWIQLHWRWSTNSQPLLRQSTWFWKWEEWFIFRDSARLDVDLLAFDNAWHPSFDHFAGYSRGGGQCKQQGLDTLELRETNGRDVLKMLPCVEQEASFILYLSHPELLPTFTFLILSLGRNKNSNLTHREHCHAFSSHLEQNSFFYMIWNKNYFFYLTTNKVRFFHPIWNNARIVSCESILVHPDHDRLCLKCELFDVIILF